MQNLCRLTLVQYAELSNIHFWLQNTDKPSPLPTKNTNQNNVTPKEAPPPKEYIFTTKFERKFTVVNQRTAEDLCFQHSCYNGELT